MIWRHYTEALSIDGYRRIKHTLAFRAFGRYLVITWCWC